jgi:hypothetical protein
VTFIKDIQKHFSPNDLQSLTDAAFTHIESVRLELGVVVLLLKNSKTATIDRIALSRTEPAAGAVRMSNKPFHEIKIPLDATENAIVKAVESKKTQFVTDWKYLFIPELSPEEARDNQRGAGILCSVVHPFYGTKQDGALIFSFLCARPNIGSRHISFIESYTEAVGKQF